MACGAILPTMRCRRDEVAAARHESPMINRCTRGSAFALLLAACSSSSPPGATGPGEVVLVLDKAPT
jgi:hypothetical protein